MNEDSMKNRPVTFGDLMRTMTMPVRPEFLTKLLETVKIWLTKTFTIDGVDMPYWELMREDPDKLFGQLGWVSQFAALLPSPELPEPKAEAVVLSLGEVDLTGAMRLAVDYSLIFSQKVCRRVWIVSDCWIYCDVAEYADHIKAMNDNGVAVKFLLVTPWGAVEIPISTIVSSLLRGQSDDNRGRNRRRREDD